MAYRYPTLRDAAHGWCPSVDEVGVSTSTVYDQFGAKNMTLAGTVAGTWQGTSGSRLLVFDGVNDAGSTAAIDLTSTNVVSVSVWASAANIAPTGIWLELSTNYNSSILGFVIYQDTVSTVNGLYSVHQGNTGNSGFRYVPSSAGSLNHYVFVFNKSLSTNETSMWRNGVLQTPNATIVNANNTNNFGNLPLFVGARNNASLFTALSWDDLLVYKRTLTSDEIGYLASARGAAYLPSVSQRRRSAQRSIRSTF